MDRFRRTDPDAAEKARKLYWTAFGEAARADPMLGSEAVHDIALQAVLGAIEPAPPAPPAPPSPRLPTRSQVEREVDEDWGYADESRPSGAARWFFDTMKKHEWATEDPEPEVEGSACAFCAIVAGEAPAKTVREWDDAIAIVPLNPVVRGHLLVLPKRHVETFFSDPDTSAATMRRVAEMVHGVERHHDPNDYNVITSAGRAATQTVFHFHVHLVPRRPGDGLHLPWTDHAEDPEPEVDPAQALAQLLAETLHEPPGYAKKAAELLLASGRVQVTPQ